MSVRSDRGKREARRASKSAIKSASKSKSTKAKAGAKKNDETRNGKSRSKQLSSRAQKKSKARIDVLLSAAKKSPDRSRKPATIVLEKSIVGIANAKFSTSRVSPASRNGHNGTNGSTGKMNGKRGASMLAGMAGYRPSESEPFMNERQRIYFRDKLLAWKDEILRQNKETLVVLHEDSSQYADVTDRATSETDRALELRARDRQRKLMAKIDAALARIEEGTYGYCEETGEPISLKRLDARPIATMSLEAQERKERMERVFRED